MLIDALKLVVMPPLCLYLTALVGACLLRRNPRLGRALLVASFALLVALSIPLVAVGLSISLQPERPAAEFDFADAQAIVVFGADANTFAPEFGGASLGALSLERVRYAAWLAQRSNLPVLLSGGVPAQGIAPLAQLMATTLEDEFGVPARWRESRSADTRENARFSADILRAEGLERIVLVTHARHLPRALSACRDAGLKARGAGTGWREFSALEWRSCMPSARALRESSWAIHEWIGRAWYALS
jgi:uncharacterized SAM-binding protein YcdF (DUF218 family)